MNFAVCLPSRLNTSSANNELPHQFSVGVPAGLLTRRPDVRMAEHAMEEAFYNTQAARSAFYPSITLQGELGWTNNVGNIVDPGKLLWNAVASLTQPIFARGKLLANLKVNKLTQEDVQNKYVQTVIDAGNQVNEAMADCQAARPVTSRCSPHKRVCSMLNLMKR